MGIVKSTSTSTATAGTASMNSSNSSNNNSKRIPLGKLALVLLFGCLYAAGTNFVLFSSFLKDGPKDRSEHYQPSAVFRAAQKKVAEANRNKGNNNNNNNTNKKSNTNHKAAHNKKQNDDDGSTYTCSYKAAKDNRVERTTVVAPKNIPSFIVAGVQKAGSTALLTYFRDHPQMLQTKHSFRREAHFFDTSWNSKVVNEAHKLGLKQANDKHCLALQEYMKLFETETILANSQTMAHEQQEEKEEQQQHQQHGEQQQQPPPRHHPLYTFEKTPSYFGNSKIPARIKQTVPWSKIVLILRNPVDRIYSQYKMTVLTNYNLRKYSIEDMIHHELMAMKKFNMTRAPMFVPVFGESNNNSSNSNNDENDPYRHLNATSYRIPEHVPFDHAVHDSRKWSPPHRAIIKKPDAGVFETENLVRRGLYSAQLKWWLKRYTAGEDLLVVNYKDLLEDTRSVYERVLGFAGIPLPANTSAIDFDKRARTDKRKDDRPLAAETRRYLEEFYAPHNAELEELLGEEWSPEKLGW